MDTVKNKWDNIWKDSAQHPPQSKCPIYVSSLPHSPHPTPESKPWPLCVASLVLACMPPRIRVQPAPLIHSQVYLWRKRTKVHSVSIAPLVPANTTFLHFPSPELPPLPVNLLRPSAHTGMGQVPLKLLYRHHLTSSAELPSEVGTMINLVLKMTKPGYRDVT